MRILYFLIPLLSVISCRNTKGKDLLIEFNTITFFDNYQLLTKTSHGMYFEIKIKNLNIKCMGLIDTTKIINSHYMSNFFIMNNKSKYKLLDMRKLNDIDKCLKFNDSLMLRLLLIKEYLKTDLKGMKEENKDLLNEDTKLIFKKDTISINEERINYYLNMKKINFKEINYNLVKDGFQR